MIETPITERRVHETDSDPLLCVFDNVLPNPERYRQWALTQPFRTHETGPRERFEGIALVEDQTLPRLVAAYLPGALTRLTFFRRSPLGQQEPNYIHSDEAMGAWTAILYLNPDPAPGDGTTFWRYRPTGAVKGSAYAFTPSMALWEAWRHVEARFNRLLLFDAPYFHSRAIEENYGEGETARLVQVAFGVYS